MADYGADMWSHCESCGRSGTGGGIGTSCCPGARARMQKWDDDNEAKRQAKLAEYRQMTDRELLVALQNDMRGDYLGGSAYAKIVFMERNWETSDLSQPPLEADDHVQ